MTLKEIDSLLILIDPPEGLIGIKDVFENLTHILPFLPEIDPIEWPYNLVDSWTKYCKNFINEKDHPEFYHYEEKTKGAGLSNYLTSHPLYSALWTKPPETIKKEAYYHLQAHLINSVHFFRSNKKDKKFDSTVYNSSLGIRNIATKIDYGKYLNSIPIKPLSAEKLYPLLDRLIVSKKNNPLVPIERLLAFVLEIRTPYSKQRHRQNTQIESITIEEESVDSESSIPQDPKKIFRSSTLTKKERSESRNEANADEEALSGPWFASEAQPLNDKLGESPEIRALTMKTKQRGMARYNQQLPTRWDRLNNYEVISLYVELYNLRDLNFKGVNTDFQEKLAVLIVIMHWTACPLEKAVKTIVVKSADFLPETFNDDRIYLCLKEQLWVISHPSLNQRRIKKDWRRHLEQTTPAIRLQINTLCWEIMREFLVKIGLDLNERCMLFKASDSKQMQKYLKVFIIKVKKKYDSRLTQIRISSHIYDLLIDQTSDVAEASIITGKMPNMGQKASLYYYSPLTSDLQRRYSKTCKKVEQIIFNNTKFSSKADSDFVIDQQSIRIGSKICPMEQTVQQMVMDLKKKTSHYKKEHHDINHLIKFHNAYTAYCVMMIGFATGYRAVRDPFYSKTEIDDETGFLVISDKDSDDYYNSRLVYLPKICRKQITLYSEYKQLLAEKLILTNPELSKELMEPNIQSWSKTTPNNQVLPFFFFLKHFYKHQAVKPLSMHEMTEWITDLPLNANRHYLRTHLRELKVSGEFIDAFMGHWEYGQEPYGKYSSLSPLSYIETLKNPIEELLNKAGWEEIKGTYG